MQSEWRVCIAGLTLQAEFEQMEGVGMRGLGVLWGYGTRDELETAGADQLVESAANLARTVLSMI